MNPSLPPDLETGEDLRFQKREWKVQRVFWSLMYGVIIAVMLGVTGKGMLSHSRLGTADGPLQLDYERFLRYRSNDDLRIAVRSHRDITRLTFNSDYFNHIGVQRILPEPKAMLMTDKTVTLVFDNIPSEPTIVTITVSPDSIGRHHGWAAVDGGARHSFTQFVYP